MNKHTLYSLVTNVFEPAAKSHPSVSSFGTGENFLLSAAGNSKAPHVWLEQPFHYQSELKEGPRTRVHDFAFLFLDKNQQDKSDELKILSKMGLVSEWFISKLHETYGEDLNLLESDTITYTEYHDDNWTGVRTELRVEVRWSVDGCDPKNSDLYKL